MLTAQQLTALSRAEKNPRKRIRLLAVAHFVEGHNRTHIAHMLKVVRRSVTVWVERYLSEGIEGLEAKKAAGRPCPLSLKQRQQLTDYIQKQSLHSTGDA